MNILIYIILYLLDLDIPDFGMDESLRKVLNWFPPKVKE